MKLVTYLGPSGHEQLGALVGEGSAPEVLDLLAVAQARGLDQSSVTDMLALLEAGPAGRDSVRSLVDWALSGRNPSHRHPMAQVSLRAPVPRPPKVLCLAGNYAEHWRESGNTAPPKDRHVPEVFIKPVSTIVGPDDIVRLPGPLCTAVDYEGELAVVIGRRAKNVAPEAALSYVAGYTNFNDISGRRLTINVPREETPRTGYFDWLNGKWFDTFGPLGPFLSIDEISDPQALRIQTRVNGQTRQDAVTGDMIFTIAETIAWISRFLTLQPGDVIATGTPSGVGSTTGTYLRAGDQVEVEVDGLGILRNSVGE